RMIREVTSPTNAGTISPRGDIVPAFIGLVTSRIMRSTSKLPRPQKKKKKNLRKGQLAS
ncbi:hypothetical protein SK128_020776, partial [Halocaridina rubra]